MSAKYTLVLWCVTASASAAERVQASKRALQDDAPKAPSRIPRKDAELNGRASFMSSPSPANAETQCDLCHTPAAWTTTTFDHAPTGFPLKGGHQRLDCKACHTKDFQAPLPTLCVGCHRDPHRGELGQRCEGCHEENHWQPLFTADAHRRTNFPLIGRHAVLPCTECHVQTPDRSFSRTATDCFGCHQRQYDQTALGSINHAAAGFGTSCRDCHEFWRFSPARFPGHDSCFRISSGSHAGIRCLSCHTALTGVSLTGSCSTGTAACSRCHEHACTRTDQQHQNVPGYQCKDRKCYECHHF